MSETLRRVPLPRASLDKAGLLALRDHLRTLAALGRAALGRARIPRTVRLAWA
ncbi:hypothetical protein [Roseomonas sp. BN140053]|uniref:hypothetical protein n=1 Tax=Roseomonas sp. BN140053 TaxID=3391898 RepID=UPI0039EA49F9